MVCLKHENMDTINKLKYLIFIIAYSVAITYLLLAFAMPIIIERRAKDLNLMQYNAQKDIFIPKDSILINASDIYYLKHGNLKNY